MRTFPAIVVTMLLLLVSCSPLKFVPADHSLLQRVGISSDTIVGDINFSQLNGYVRQQANQRWFSALKIPLAIYSLAGRDSSRWINRTLMAMGEAPVIFDTLLTQQSCNNLKTALVNMGYVRAGVETKTSVKGRKGRKKNVEYVLHPGRRYRLRNVEYEVQDSIIAQMLKLDDPVGRGLKSGDKFSITQLDEERKRITSILVNNGYYRFNKEEITFDVDTVVGQPLVDIRLVLHHFVDRRTQQVALHPCYKVRKLNFLSGDETDSIIHLRPAVLRTNSSIRPNTLYAYNDLLDTYRRFGRLQAVKYTNVTFKEVGDSGMTTGEHELDCQILVSTNKPSTISFQPEGTNTAGDLGAAASLTYENCNLFRGSEVLSMELRGAFEAIRGLEGYKNNNFEEYSVETKLSFPRFIMPFLTRNFQRRVNATSEVSMLYDLQNRPEYHRRVLSLAWRYKWNNANHHDRYQVDMLQLNYVFMPWISSKFRSDYLDDNTNRNAILRYNYEDLFIMKLGFGYSYNNGVYAVKSNIETAGNLLSLYSSVAHMECNELGQKKVFNIAFAQYAKVDFDYVRNFRIDYNNTLVFHLGFGLAYPYGNSNILPFEKRYFSGGANSVRGWSVRNLGPGKFRGKDGNIDFINQTGDRKLDVNLEYRAHLFWKIDGALFIDAGNVWTLRNYEDQPGGQFAYDTFLEQIAVGYGMGFRFNFDYFILRFDMGMKGIDPAYERASEHYPFTHPRLSRDFTFHFAVGLPF